MNAYVVCRTKEEADKILPVLAKKLNLTRADMDIPSSIYIRVSMRLGTISYGYGLCNIKKVYIQDLTAG